MFEQKWTCDFCKYSDFHSYFQKMFLSAHQAEIIRSKQKDEYYSSYIWGTLSNLTEALLDN